MPAHVSCCHPQLTYLVTILLGHTGLGHLLHELPVRPLM